MTIEFITQRVPEHISSGDEIALFSEYDDGTPSGRYKVAAVTQEGGVTLVGMGHLEGTITVICMGADDD